MAVAIPIVDSEWHAKRQRHIGASEVASLFGLSPYMSRWTLWHRKAGSLPAPELDSERVLWGQRLEAAIAKGIAEDQGWQIRKVRRYMSHATVAGMGASLDYEILGQPDGMGAFEVKNVDWAVYRSKWDSDNAAPMHIELQLQHQLAVAGWEWGAIGCLIGGNTSEIIRRDRHLATIAKIEAGVAEFWRSVQKGDAPPLEDAADLALMASVFKREGVATLGPDEAFDAMIETLKSCQMAEKQAAQKVDEAKIRIVQYLDALEAETAISDRFKASYKEQTRKAHEVKEATFRVLRTSSIKQKGE